jgi:hypothetical protein
VLERKAPPTFDVLVEQEERHLVGVHHDVAASVDALLRGEAPQREMRERQPDGAIRRWSEHTPRAARADAVGLPTREQPVRREDRSGKRAPRPSPLAGEQPRAPWWEQPRESAYDARVRAWLDADLARGAPPEDAEGEDSAFTASTTSTSAGAPVAATTEAGPGFRKRRVFAMGINRNHLDQAIRELGLPAVISREEREADAVLVLKSLYRKQPDRVDGFEARGVPVFVLRSAGVDRIREALAELYRMDLQRARAAQTTAPASDD